MTELMAIELLPDWGVVGVLLPDYSYALMLVVEGAEVPEGV